MKKIKFIKKKLNILNKIIKNNIAIELPSEENFFKCSHTCENCDEYFDSEQNIINHELKTHLFYINGCDRCLKLYKDNFRGQIKCKICDKKLITEYKTHLSHYLNNMTYKYICIIERCYITFKNRRAMERHHSSVHQSYKDEQVNILLGTVIKRRYLKKSGSQIDALILSSPIKLLTGISGEKKTKKIINYSLSECHIPMKYEIDKKQQQKYFRTGQNSIKKIEEKKYLSSYFCSTNSAMEYDNTRIEEDLESEKELNLRCPLDPLGKFGFNTNHIKELWKKKKERYKYIQASINFLNNANK